ncbi:hypothetical protein KC330_g58 [Hortaea werneckii]|nr:hypothetical protein KC330_g58 [Hortaea werneckii]
MRVSVSSSNLTSFSPETKKWDHFQKIEASRSLSFHVAQGPKSDSQVRPELHAPSGLGGQVATAGCQVLSAVISLSIRACWTEEPKEERTDKWPAGRRHKRQNI